MTSERPASSSRAPESFQPIAVTSPTKRPLFFALRCLVDLQLSTITRFLRPALAQLNGEVLDVGAGQSPWRVWLPKETSYQGIDVGYAGEFGMESKQPDVTYYDGGVMPFSSERFDSVICIEVLEHSEDPDLLIREVSRVMKKGGTLLLTVPWSARLHHIPHDYHRFTRMRLQNLFEKNGFGYIEIHERGNDICTIANKLTILSIRLLLPPPRDKAINALWQYPLAIVCSGLAAAFIVCAHLSLLLRTGSADDPLGYFVSAKRLNEN